MKESILLVFCFGCVWICVPFDRF